MSMKYLLDSQLMCFNNSLVSSYKCMLSKLILHSFCDKKVVQVFKSYNVGRFSNVTCIKKNVSAKFIEYCEEC